ncbi:ankyrin-3-like [Saccostrea cucullata]|uniref:ankyrin-3-like n=1 Tax=Saccostrea cuccullata TaxID=36930 RepID=UPI002ED11204
MTTSLDPHTNFARACRAIINLNTDILRDELDSHITPGDIARKANVSTSLPNLRPEQWASINNAAAKGSYEDFDSSLLYIMIRNLCPLSQPLLGWNRKPPPTDLSVAADVERIRYYRNEVYGHTTRAEISDSEFNSIWWELEKISERFDRNRPGKNYKKKLVSLSHCCMDEKMRQAMEEKMKSNKLLEEAKKQRYLVEDWKIQDKKFVETRACRAVREELKTKNIVTIVGNSGSGKSFIARHLALEYQKHDWNIFLVDHVLEFKRIADPSSPHRQFFVLDDPVGKYCLDEVSFNEWLKIDKSLSGVFENKIIKVLITCRKSVIYEIIYTCFLSANIVEIDAKKLQLDNDEKKRILECYVAKETLKDEEIELIIRAELLFPLLCRLFTENENYRMNGIHFFQNPTPVVIAEINKYKSRKKEKYLALVLLVVHGGTINTDKFLDFNKSRAKFEEICEICEVDRNVSRVVIINHLHSLVGSFVQKVESTFSFLHDFLEDVTSFVFGKHSPVQLLKYCSLKLIRQKVQVITEKNMDESHENNDFCITIDEKYIDTLVERLLKEIFLNNTVEICMCPSLRHEKVVKNIANRIDCLAIKDFRNFWIKCQKQHVLFAQSDIIFEEERKYFITKFDVIENDPLLSALNIFLIFNHDKICEFILTRIEYENLKLNDTENKKLILANCINGNIAILQRIKLLSGEDILTKQLEEDGSHLPLHLSAAFNNISISRFLLGLNCDVNGDNRNTALFLAVCNGHYASTKILLENKADVNMRSKYNNRTPLFCASEDGFEDIVYLLLEYEADVNICLHSGMSPLYVACDSGHSGIVKVLLENDANVNLCECSGWSPLSVAAYTGSISIVKLLLENKANVNLCDMDGRSPLFAASVEGHLKIVKTLLKSKADVNLCDNLYRSPLFAATIEGHINIVEKLLKSQADVNIHSDSNSWTPLLCASKDGFENIVHLLLQYKADVNMCLSNGMSPLYVACESGHINIVKTFLENDAEVNLCEHSGWSPLSVAAFTGSISIVEILLENGANVNLCDINGRSPLFAASVEGHIGIVRTLLKNKADVNLCHNDGRSPLYVASIKGHFSIVEILLGNKADVNLCDRYGRSPLFAATVEGHIEIVKLLLENKADVNLCVKDGWNPLCSASRNGNYDIVKLLLQFKAHFRLSDDTNGMSLLLACIKGHEKITKLLLKNTVAVNFRDVNGLTPLHQAIMNGHDNIVMTLIESNADVNLRDTYGKSPLFVAAESHIRFVEHLLQFGADANICDESGFTPLHYCCSLQQNDIVKMLVENKANINIYNSEGISPLFVACLSEHESTVKLLLESGADVNQCDRYGFSAVHIAAQKGHIPILNILLNFQPNLDYQTSHNGLTALHLAVLFSHERVLKALLTHKISIDIGDKQRRTALHKACLLGNKNIVELLLRFGADVTQKDMFSKSAIDIARKRHFIRIERLLMESLNRRK